MGAPGIYTTDNTYAICSLDFNNQSLGDSKNSSCTVNLRTGWAGPSGNHGWKCEIRNDSQGKVIISSLLLAYKFGWDVIITYEKIGTVAYVNSVNISDPSITSRF